MDSRHLSVGLLLAVSISIWGCDLGQAPPSDSQFIKIQYKYFFRDSVDTFNGTLTKDLVADGTVTIPFRFTTEAQESILAEVGRSHFYDLPDTIRGSSGVSVTPDPGPQLLRVEIEGRSHQVVWYTTSDNAEILSVSGFIRRIVQSTPEYKNLPPARGAYL